MCTTTIVPCPEGLLRHGGGNRRSEAFSIVADVTDMAAEPAPLPEARRRAVVRQALSVGIATGLYCVSFGALSVASGLSIWESCALSLLLFSGGSQFAIIGVLGGGGSAGAAIAGSTLLGIRNAMYGMQLKPSLQSRGLPS